MAYIQPTRLFGTIPYEKIVRELILKYGTEDENGLYLSISQDSAARLVDSNDVQMFEVFDAATFSTRYIFRVDMRKNDIEMG